MRRGPWYRRPGPISHYAFDTQQPPSIRMWWCGRLSIKALSRLPAETICLLRRRVDPWSSELTHRAESTHDRPMTRRALSASAIAYVADDPHSKSDRDSRPYHGHECGFGIELPHDGVDARQDDYRNLQQIIGHSDTLDRSPIPGQIR